jgi:hypothetical protein
MIDMSVVLCNPDFCQAFTAQRSTGQFGLGGFVSSTATVNLYGSVQVADAKTLEQIPEGDRVVGSRVFWSVSPMYETRDGETEGLSDILVHNGHNYRVTKVWDWADNGYFKAYAVRMDAA